jgi:hypothetical protein
MNHMFGLIVSICQDLDNLLRRWDEGFPKALASACKSELAAEFALTKATWV